MVSGISGSPRAPQQSESHNSSDETQRPSQQPGPQTYGKTTDRATIPNVQIGGSSSSSDNANNRLRRLGIDGPEVIPTMEEKWGPFLKKFTGEEVAIVCTLMVLGAQVLEAELKHDSTVDKVLTALCKSTKIAAPTINIICDALMAGTSEGTFDYYDKDNQRTAIVRVANSLANLAYASYEVASIARGANQSSVPGGIGDLIMFLRDLFWLGLQLTSETPPQEAKPYRNYMKIFTAARMICFGVMGFFDKDDPWSSEELHHIKTLATIVASITTCALAANLAVDRYISNLTKKALQNQDLLQEANDYANIGAESGARTAIADFVKPFLPGDWENSNRDIYRLIGHLAAAQKKVINNKVIGLSTDLKNLEKTGLLDNEKLKGLEERMRVLAQDLGITDNFDTLTFYKKVLTLNSLASKQEQELQIKINSTRDSRYAHVLKVQQMKVIETNIILMNIISAHDSFSSSIEEYEKLELSLNEIALLVARARELEIDMSGQSLAREQRLKYLSSVPNNYLA